LLNPTIYGGLNRRNIFQITRYMYKVEDVQLG